MSTRDSELTSGSGQGRSPAVDVAHEHDENAVEILSTGVRARIVPVAASLIEEVTRRIRDPEIPMVMDEDRGREIPNDNDPHYLRELGEAHRARGEAALEAMILFGVELIDGLPEGDGWLKKLRFLSKRGLLDLEGYDLDDELDREFVYKRYIAVGSADFMRIGEMAGLTEEGIRAATDSFRRDEGRDTDN